MATLRMVRLWLGPCCAARAQRHTGGKLGCSASGQCRPQLAAGLDRITHIVTLNSNRNRCAMSMWDVRGRL